MDELLFKDKLNPIASYSKKLSRTFFYRLLKGVTSTTFLVIVVSAALGPYLLKHTLDKIELTKLQTTLITNVIEHASKVNFKTPEDVFKLEFISKMVNENYPVFGVKLEKTALELDKWKSLDFRERLEKAIEENNQLERELSDAKNEKRITDSILSQAKIRQKQLSSLARDLSKKEKESLEKLEETIFRLGNNSKRFQETINRINYEQKIKEKELNENKIEMAKLKSILENKEQDVKILRETLKKTIENLEIATVKVAALAKENKQLNQDIAYLTNQLNKEKEIKRPLEEIDKELKTLEQGSTITGELKLQ